MEEALPVCKFGAACYRKNPDHLRNFAHPPPQSPEKSCEPEAAAASSENPNPLVVLLVGVPGSGKSRFCHNVSENAAQAWTRICQDVIANGKRGTKAHCIKEATSSLNSLTSVFIDRTNLTKDQRLEFVEFAKNSDAETHAVVLNLPVGTCITRAMNRTGHEGGLEGKKVGAVIQRMANGFELPTLEEGFSRITICRTDADVENAIGTYSKLDSTSKLEPGVFDSNSKPNVKGSLEQFFRPVQKQNQSADEKQSQNVEGKQKMADASPSVKVANASAVSSAVKTAELKLAEGDEKEAKTSWKTLAFPSISTADFFFDHEKAAGIIVETAAAFLKRDESSGLRLAMVDIEPGSDMLSRVRRVAASAGLDRERFLIIPGDITKLRSTGRAECFAIANAANWRLKGGGGGVNLAIYRAAGAGFEEATKKCASTLDVGKALAVSLPSASPLRREGVSYVIHVLGPNMNPRRPNCIENDYTEGCRLLRAAYTALFSTFASVAKGNTGTHEEAAAGNSGGNQNAAAPQRDAFAVLMKRKNGNDESAASLKRGKAGTSADPVKNIAETGTGNAKAEAGAGSRKAKSWPGWAQALHDTAFHPEKHQDVILEVTDQAVVLPDLYGKGRKHLLVVSREPGLDSITDLRNEHLPLLREMHGIGERWARKMMQEDSSLVFRLGYHWVASMRQLHLHVISQDFDSPGLKNKKHWNSFTSSYFRDSKDVISEVESSGGVESCSEEMEKQLLDSELRCHRCRSVQPSFPRLKSHLNSCDKPLQCQASVLI